jgi:peroxiredoxin
VRSDDAMGDTFCKCEYWDTGSQDLSDRMGGAGGVSSVSGNERNHLFLNQSGSEFLDISLVSGMDHPGDSRTVVMWDYDRDGWQDIAVVNANAPVLTVFRNRIGELQKGSTKNQVIAIRLIGANQSATAAPDKSSRDGFGARIKIKAASLQITREFRCGEGFAGQNSSTMLIGIGQRDLVQTVKIIWPSGKIQEFSDVAAGTLLTINEAQDGEAAATRESYLRPVPPVSVARNIDRGRLQLGMATDDKPLRVYTTTATWCWACKRQMPHLSRLRDRFEQQVAFLGIPVDPKDTREMLEEYIEEIEPPFDLVLDLTDDDRKQVASLLTVYGLTPAVPSTIVTDSKGNVLFSTAGVLSVSDVAKFLRRANDSSSAQRVNRKDDVSIFSQK